MWQELIAVFQQILDVYEKVAVLYEKKQRLLAAVELEKVERLLPKEREMVRRIEELETKRRQVLEKISQAENVDAANKYTELFTLCDPATERKLKTLHFKLREAIALVERKKKSADVLAWNCLCQVNYRLNVISQLSVGPTYAPGGQERVLSKNRLDFKT